MTGWYEYSPLLFSRRELQPVYSAKLNDIETNGRMSDLTSFPVYLWHFAPGNLSPLVYSAKLNDIKTNSCR
jgi:hypothetical protein